MGVNFRFIQDDTLGGYIEVTVRAAEKNERVEKLLSVLSEQSGQLVYNQLFSDKYHINTSEIILIMRDVR